MIRQISRNRAPQGSQSERRSRSPQGYGLSRQDRKRTANPIFPIPG
jgi:hypothetical protein